MPARDHLSKQQFMDVYHGTDTRSAARIARTGLRPAEDSPDVATVAHDRESAEYFAHDAADYRKANPALVHMRIPATEWESTYRGSAEGRGFGLRATVPPEYVHAVEKLTKQPRSGFYG